MQVLVPDLEGVETPVSGVVVAALPYDRDSVIAEMERRAPVGRPNTQALDTLFQAFHTPFLDFSRAAWRAELLTRRRDSLVLARKKAADGSPAAAELDARLIPVDDSLKVHAPELERKRATLAAARDTLWPRIERLKTAANAWETSTYAGYDTLVRVLTRDRLKTSLADTTGTGGWGVLRLVSGRWWLYARATDPQDPNFQWYWNIPEGGDDTVRLNPATGRRLPRY